MKRKLLLILLHFSLIPVVQAQPIWQWLKTGGGSTATNSIDMTYAIVKDSSNNLYSCGNFHGTNVPIGTSTYTSATKNGFVQKKNQNGSPIWQYITSCTGNVSIYNIVLDTNDDVIFCGQYSGTLTIGSTVLYPGIGTNSSFVCKLNGLTGLPIWAVAFKSAGDATSDIIATGLAAHPDGSIYVSGNFKGTGLTFNS